MNCLLPCNVSVEVASAFLFSIGVVLGELMFYTYELQRTLIYWLIQVHRKAIKWVHIVYIIVRQIPLRAWFSFTVTGYLVSHEHRVSRSASISIKRNEKKLFSSRFKLPFLFWNITRSMLPSGRFHLKCHCKESKNSLRIHFKFTTNSQWSEIFYIFLKNAYKKWIATNCLVATQCHRYFLNSIGFSRE